ncbi:MAG: hypothetical protein R2867_00675 [Caldilineaceae bacterium]
MKQLILLLVALAAMAGTSGTIPADIQAAPLSAVQQSQLQGTLYDPPRPAFHLALPATTGTDLHLRTLQGKVVLLFSATPTVPMSARRPWPILNKRWRNRA